MLPTFYSHAYMALEFGEPFHGLFTPCLQSVINQLIETGMKEGFFSRVIFSAFYYYYYYYYLLMCEAQKLKVGPQNPDNTNNIIFNNSTLGFCQTPL